MYQLSAILLVAQLYYDSCFVTFGFVALNVIKSKLTIWLVSLSFQLSWGCGSFLADSSSGACQCVKGCLVRSFLEHEEAATDVLTEAYTLVLLGSKCSLSAKWSM
ncbi:uncharacterized protein LOC117926373 isoform X2 [Vitis riparia]|uniref:uncharacterized protein LOC117926373 isoform X2 n=1 Tax=Vitis riparia TaxID=96939 RepID=UPI00155AF851|nr:uncharacterized protein LOC117926373 isoform X2 [Vitis riparia]